MNRTKIFRKIVSFVLAAVLAFPVAPSHTFVTVVNAVGAEAEVEPLQTITTLVYNDEYAAYEIHNIDDLNAYAALVNNQGRAMRVLLL